MKITIEVNEELVSRLVQEELNSLLNPAPTAAALSVVGKYAVAHKRLWTIPPNWTDPAQSKWALVLDLVGIKAVEAFTGYQYPVIFPTRASALAFVDDAGYEAVQVFLGGLEDD